MGIKMQDFLLRVQVDLRYTQIIVYATSLIYGGDRIGTE